MFPLEYLADCVKQGTVNKKKIREAYLSKNPVYLIVKLKKTCVLKSWRVANVELIATPVNVLMLRDRLYPFPVYDYFSLAEKIIEKGGREMLEKVMPELEAYACIINYHN